MIEPALGASNKRNSYAAGAGAAKAALAGLAPEARPSLALAFCAGGHDPSGFLHGLRDSLGDIPVLGGSVVGLVTRELLGCEGYECGVLLLPDTLAQPVVLAEHGLEQDEQAVGRRLGRRLAQAARPNDPILLLYDSVRANPPAGLNVGSRLVEGLLEGFGGEPRGLVGAGLIADLECQSSFVFDGEGVSRGAAVAMVFPDGVGARSTVMHGCAPVSAFRTVTAARGAEILELDGKPALDALLEFLDYKGGESHSRIPFNLTLGRKHGDLFAPDDEDAFVNRLIQSVDPVKRSLLLFEADFEEGAKIQIMSRSDDLMVESAKLRSGDLVGALGVGERALFGLYIDCAGRSGLFSKVGPHEAQAVLDELPAGMPLLGFYSGVEIAQVVGRPRPLDWTGVLSLYTVVES